MDTSAATPSPRGELGGAPRHQAAFPDAEMAECSTPPPSRNESTLREPSVPDSHSQPAVPDGADSSTVPPPLTLSGSQPPGSPDPVRRLSFREAVAGPAEPHVSPPDARVRPRGLPPAPEAIAAVRRLYDDDGNPAAILAAAKQAQPEAIPDALFSIKAQVSSTLFGVSRPALIMALSAIRDYDAVRAVVEAGAVIQVHRQPRNMLLLYLRTEQAKVALAGQHCQFMGRTLRFESLNPLSDAFYVDVLGIRSDVVASRIFAGFLGNGCQPIYFDFTYRAPGTATTSGIVRYYFNSSTCRKSLVVNGHVCDQVLLGGTAYSARARGAQALQYHLRPSKVSEHALRFSLPNRRPVTDGAGTAAVSGEKRHRRSPEATGATRREDTAADTVTSTDNAGDDPTTTPSSAPASKAATSPMFSSPPRKRLARRKPVPAAAQKKSFSSPNYWNELEQVLVELTSQVVPLGDGGESLRVMAESIVAPPLTRTSHEHHRLFEVRRGKVHRSKEATQLGTTLSLLDKDAEAQRMALHRELDGSTQLEDLSPTRDDKLAVTSDALRRSMAKNHLHFLGRMFRLMRTKDALVDDFVRVHLISRAVASGAPESCAPIKDK